MGRNEQDEVVPVLTDGTVTLRALREDDLDAVVEQSRDPQTQAWTLSVPADYDRADAEDFLTVTTAGWESGACWQWAVEADGVFAGLVSLGERGDGVREVGFVGHPATRGRGHLTRAVRLACAYAFEQGCPLVLWHARAGNVASRRVAWRAGFSLAAGTNRAWRRGGLRELWSGTLTPDQAPEPRTDWPVPATLEGDGIRLRAWRDGDGAHLPETRDDLLERGVGEAAPTRGTYAAWLLPRRTREAAGELLAWAVTDAATDAVLGGVQLFRMGVPTRPGSAALAVWLLPDARHRGLGQAALDTLLRHAFAPTTDGGLGLHRVDAEAGTDHRGSLRLLRRSGFREVGTARDELATRDGGVEDTLHLEVLATDDRAVQAVEPLEIPTLETERLRLRPFRDDDGPGEGDGPDEASRRFLPAGAHPDQAAYPAWLARHRRRQDAGEALTWCLADRTTDRALGYLAVFRMGPLPDRFDAEVGYFLYPSGRGQGYLSEALTPAVEHAFRELSAGGLGLTRLHAETDLENLASQVVLEKAGFRRWGTDRQSFRRADGSLSDGAFFELLATDERPGRGSRVPAPLTEVTLEAADVRLRPFREDDALRIVQACGDARTRQWLSALPAPYRLDDALGYVARSHAQARSGQGLYLALAAPDDDRLLGAAALMGLGGETPGQAEIGYWTHPDARGRGAMTTAVGCLVRHAFTPVDAGGLGLRRLVLRAAAGNAASQHVAEASGFVRTGLQRRAEPLGDGTWDDLVDFDLLADEWDPRAD